MGSFKKTWYVLFCVGLIGLQVLVQDPTNDFFVTFHEGDVLHTMQISFRMLEGEVPHLDFLTPIGEMAFAPIVVLLNAGFGIGSALLYSQILMALLWFPALAWVGLTRFKGYLSFVFATVVILMFTAVIYGGIKNGTSMSMHYNRWCWAVSFLVLTIILLPSKWRPSGYVDGLIIGFGMVFLAMTKVTFFVYLAPAVLLSLILFRKWAALAVAVLSGLLAVAYITMTHGGFEYWAHYLDDLRFVSQSSVRPKPGLNLTAMAFGPSYLIGTLGLFFAIVFLRQAGKKNEGLILLVLSPGLVLVTYQNWGNDPLWALLIGMILFPMSQGVKTYNRWGWDLALALKIVGLLLIVHSSPSLINLALSSIKHSNYERADFVTLMPQARHGDLLVQKEEVERVTGIRELTAFPRYEPDPDGKSEATLLNGEVLPLCSIGDGFQGALQRIAANLDSRSNMKGKRILFTDTLNNLWLFSDVERLKGGSPWYYGGTPGFENADFLVVPLCPVNPMVRRLILEAISKQPGLDFSEVGRDEQIIVLERK